MSARANGLVWLALIALTFVSFTVSDTLGRAALLPILAAAAGKSAMVGFQFMGLRQAHPMFRAVFAVLIGVLVTAVWIAQRTS